MKYKKVKAVRNEDYLKEEHTKRYLRRKDMNKEMT